MLKTINKILSGVTSSSYVGMFDVGGPYPNRGQFLIRGAMLGTNSLQKLGYVTQIRVAKGQFKSDMYFLRLADGSLITCENDCYIPITPAQEVLARIVFQILPENEGFDQEHEYRDCDGVSEHGFIVYDSKSKPLPNAPFAIALTTATK